jgi:hypothetical protein
MVNFIIMTFNLHHKGHLPTYEGNPCWLEQRLNIFKKYCINAFSNQTDPNFHLLIYCDNNTPDPYKSELLKLESEYEFITICWDLSKYYGENFDRDFKISQLNNIKTLMGDNSQEFICSRFENDDIPEVRYNEFVKLAHQHYDIISLAKGLYWDINTNEFLDSTFPTGPFISVKTTLENFMSPLEEEHHNYITKRGGHPIITKENLWIQLIHGDNVWNRMDRMPGSLIPPPSKEFLKVCFAHE